jgi:hypothetical protein
MTVMFHVEVFWVLMPAFEGYMVGILPQHHTASQPRKTPLESKYILYSCFDFESVIMFIIIV